SFDASEGRTTMLLPSIVVPLAMNSGTSAWACPQLRNAVVAQHDLVAAVFLVADVLAPLAVLRRGLFERRDFDRDAALSRVLARRGHGKFGAGQRRQLNAGQPDLVCDDRVGRRPSRQK